MAVMRFSVLTLITMLTLCVAAGSSSAQELAQVPDPARLDSEWWKYIAPDPPLDADELARRIARLQEAAQASLGALDIPRRVELQPLLDQTKGFFERFASLRQADAPVLPAVAAAAESYSLEDALGRHRASRSLRLDIAVLQEEIDWQKELIRAEKRRLSQQKIQYLEQAPASPDRTRLGLGLIDSRLKLEIAELEQKQRQSKHASMVENLATLSEELEQIAPRLTAAEEELPQRNRQREEALSKGDKLRSAIEEQERPRAVDGDGAEEPDTARLAALRAVALNIEAAEQDLLAQKAELAAVILQFVAGTPDIDTAKQALRATDVLFSALEPSKGYWKRTGSRIKSSVVGQDAARLTANDKKALKLADEIGQAMLRLEREQDSTLFLDNLLNARIRMREGTLKRWFSTSLDGLAVSWAATRQLATASMFEINETPITIMGLLRVVFIITVALLLSKALRRALASIAVRRTGVNQSSLYTLGRVIHYFVLIVGVIIGLSSIGIDFTKFALLASALGIGIGFGMQTLVSNFVAGLIILFEKSLKVGDFVELESGVAGEVREVNMRSTLVTTNDNVDILVPNADFINKAVTNWTMREVFRRIHIPFGVAYGTDKELVRKAVLEAADRVQWTLKDNQRRAPQVWFINFGESSLDFELVVWLTRDAVKRPGSVHANYLWDIESSLKQYGIEIPFPQRDLHLRSGFEAGKSRES